MIISYCFDSFEVDIEAEVVPEASFDFELRGDICTEPVQVIFTNLSTRTANYTSYLWDFGNGQTSTDFEPVHIYPREGNYEVMLIATNAFGCSDTFIDLIPYPRPRAEFGLANAKGCAPLPVHFSDSSANATEWLWQFGDGEFSTEENPTHVYGIPGIYTVTLIISYDGTCRDTTTKVSVVEIFETPVAGFIWEDVFPNNPSLLMQFKDRSLVEGTQFFWDFGDGETSTERNPVHQFESNDTFNVMFVTTIGNGCTDTLVQRMVPRAAGRLFVPSALAPNIGQGDDALFLPKGVGLKQYHIAVYNHWGNLVWESTAVDEAGAPAEGWNGRINGVLVNGNVFVWKVHAATFIDGTSWPEKKEGTLTLIR